MDSTSPGPLSRCTSMAALISTLVRSIARWKSGCILRLVQGLSPTTHDFFYRTQRRERRYECSSTPSDEADRLTLRYLLKKISLHFIFLCSCQMVALHEDDSLFR